MPGVVFPVSSGLVAHPRRHRFVSLAVAPVLRRRECISTSTTRRMCWAGKHVEARAHQHDATVLAAPVVLLRRAPAPLSLSRATAPCLTPLLFASCGRRGLEQHQRAGGFHRHHHVGDGAVPPDLPRSESRVPLLFIRFAPVPLSCPGSSRMRARVFSFSNGSCTRILSGRGREGPNPSSKSSSNLTAATFAPPLAAAVSLSYSLEASAWCREVLVVTAICWRCSMEA